MTNKYGSKKSEKSAIMYPRTISEEVLKAWNALRRRGDAASMVEDLGFSRPIIDRALNFGHVNSNILTDLITKWYVQRANKEKEGANELNGFASESEGATNEKV